MRSLVGGEQNNGARGYLPAVNMPCSRFILICSCDRGGFFPVLGAVSHAEVDDSIDS